MIQIGIVIISLVTLLHAQVPKDYTVKGNQVVAYQKKGQKKPPHKPTRTHPNKPHSVTSDSDLASISSTKSLIQYIENLKGNAARSVMRWIVYCFRSKTDQDARIELLEAQLALTNDRRKLDVFIQHVQELQGRLGFAYKKMKNDPSYMPTVRMNLNGTITWDDKKYSLAEVEIADIGGLVEKVRGLQKNRLVPENLEEKKKLVQEGIDKIKQDPMSYFYFESTSGQETLEEIVRDFKSTPGYKENMDVSDTVLESILATLVGDKKNYYYFAQKLHPDKNPTNKEQAEVAFKNYNIFRSNYDIDNDNPKKKAEWNGTFGI